MDLADFKAKLLNGVADADKIIAVRFVECVVELSNLDKTLHVEMREILDLIFEHFFKEDDLVKVTLIDFIIDIWSSKWNAEYLIENGFITKILDQAVSSGDVYGLINHRFIIAIACIYQKFPNEFGITDDYFHFLKVNMESTHSNDKDCILNALFWILQYKASLKTLVNDTDFIINWLKSAKYLSEDLRKSFFMSLKSLLFMPEDWEELEEYNPIIYRIFSNITTPENYAEGVGNIKEAISYVVKYILIPVESDEAKVLHFSLLHELIQWHWGYKELFKNGDFVKYLLNRKKSEQKPVLEAKYEFVTKVISSPLFDPKMDCLDSTIAEQLKNYYKNGIYGVDIEEVDNDAGFQVATEGTS
jgi:hypothetical protein